MNPIKMSVVIATLGKSPHLRGLLEHLQRQICGFQFEVLVVSNLPSQPLRQLVQSMRGQFEYLEIGRIGVNLARNKGFERAHGDVVLFLDDDTLLESDRFLQMHWDKHAQFQDTLAIGGTYRLPPSASLLNRIYDQMTKAPIERTRQDSRNNVSQLFGGNLSIKRNMHFDRLNPFDDVLLFGESEASFCQRLALAGGKLKLFDDLGIEHSTDLNLFAFCKKAFLRGAGRRWRNDHLAQLPFQFMSNWITLDDIKNSDSMSRSNLWQSKILVLLYELFFEFGYKENPYALSDRLTPMPVIKRVRFLFFVLLKTLAHTTMRVRHLHRALYVTVRSASMNASSSRAPHALPPLVPQVPQSPAPQFPAVPNSTYSEPMNNIQTESSVNI